MWIFIRSFINILNLCHFFREKFKKTNLLNHKLYLYYFHSLLTLSFLLLTACHSATVASNAATSIPLMCYVCEDCAKITKQTPLEACDAEFFDKSSTAIDPNTEPPTTTTTEMTADSTTTTPIGTTLVATETTTTTTGRTEATPPPETANPTPEAVPTPPTVGPPITVPTPPNVGTVDDLLIATEASGNNSTESTVSYEGPKALPLLSANYTYHCYSVQKKGE